MVDSSITADSAKLYRKLAIAFALLIVLPFMLSLINLQFAQSWKVHFFPASTILSAIIFGATGGLVAGLTGSIYSAVLLGNPYLIAGNALFGLLTGTFYKKTNQIIVSVLLAFICELPWLIISDYYFMHLSAEFIAKLAVVLLLANLFWAALIQLINKPLRKIL